jgi:hypothetical protein
MTELEETKERDSNEEALRDDLARHLGHSKTDGDRFEILRLALTDDWPEALSVYYALKKERHGRIFYHYVCYEGEIYSPLAPDGLERLLKRLLESRRFELKAEQLANLLLMYNRPEPMVMLVTDIVRDLTPASRSMIERDYGIKEIAPKIVKLGEDLKLTFWTLNLRRECLKFWTAYITNTGRIRVSEEGTIELREKALD